MKPELHYLILNNIAYADVLIGDRSLLAEADTYSAEAYKNAPWLPPIIGTRGAVLVELGQVEPGIGLLKQALEKHTDAQSKALNACYLAIAESRRDNATTAQKYLETARSLDSTCYLLQKAEQLIELNVDAAYPALS